MNAPGSLPKAGKAMLVGRGQGSHDHLTAGTRSTIAEGDSSIGYVTDNRPVADPVVGKAIIRKSMTAEREGALEVLAGAHQGRKVILIRSGEAGVYGMAGPTFEVLFQAARTPDSAIGIEIISSAPALTTCTAPVGGFAACQGGQVRCIQPDGTWYYNVTDAHMDRIVAAHLVHGRVAGELVFHHSPAGERRGEFAAIIDPRRSLDGRRNTATGARSATADRVKREQGARFCRQALAAPATVSKCRCITVVRTERPATGSLRGVARRARTVREGDAPDLSQRSLASPETGLLDNARGPPAKGFCNRSSAGSRGWQMRFAPRAAPVVLFVQSVERWSLTMQDISDLVSIRRFAGSRLLALAEAGAGCIAAL